MGNQIPTSKGSSLSPFFNSDQEAIKALEAEGRKLKYIAIKVWRRYLASYKPVFYVRTRKSQKSIKLGKVKKVGLNEYGIEVTYDNGLVYHDSVIGKEQPQGHAIMLISTGWTVKKGCHKNIKHFGYRDGFNYLGKVQEEYDKVKDARINLEIQWIGKK